MTKAGATLDVAIVGAGFAGLYMLLRIRRLGLSARVYEAGDGVGGTWYWNRYPGARCDIESMQYSYSFDPELEQEWRWSERYATQGEILRYLNHVADRFDLRRDIQLKTRVAAARFDEASDRWTLSTDAGETVRAQFCIMATGALSAAQRPDIPGLARFAGRVLHTGAWPHEPVDLSGLRVGLIGTGSSGVQAAPEIAKQAASLCLFQRTATFSVPARNAPLTEDYERQWKANYPERRRIAREKTRTGTLTDPPKKSALEVGEEERHRAYMARWSAGGPDFFWTFNDLVTNEAANETAAEFVRARIREIVKDPDVAQDLMPHEYPIFSKRICVDTDYYAMFNRSNVTLVNLRKTPIVEILADGIRTSARDYQLDAIVLATGFDAITGALNAIDIVGAGGRRLRDKWAAGPLCYLGVMSAGFPNMFIVTGPGSPSVFSNFVVSIEQHVDWISDCIADLRRGDVSRIDADPEAEQAWVAHVADAASQTLFTRAASWYLGANTPGKPRVFMPYVGGVNVFRRKCAEVAANGYQGFVLTQREVPASATVR